MEYKISFDDANGAIVLETSGTANLEDMLAMINDVADQLDKYDAFRLLVDHSELLQHNDLPSDQFRTFAEMNTKYRRHLENTYIATVCRTQLIYGLSRMWTQIIEICGVEPTNELFHNREEALAWLSSTKRK